MSEVTPLTFLNDSSIAARTSAQLCNKVTRLGTPSRTCGVRMSLDQARHVATQQPELKPGELDHLGGPPLLLCSLHLPKSLNFTYAFKCYQQNCSWLHFTWTTLYSFLSQGVLERCGRPLSDRFSGRVKCVTVQRRHAIPADLYRRFQQACLGHDRQNSLVEKSRKPSSVFWTNGRVTWCRATRVPSF